MKRQINDEACICYLEDISNMFERGKENCAGAALEFQQKYIDALQYAIKELRKNAPPTEDEWIPIKIRELTEEEKEEYPDSTFMYDCKLPEDGEEVLITTWNGQVALDTFYRDDGCYFETYCDEEDVIAWQYKPKPYKKGDDER